jgi:TolA-binding protein
MKIFKKILLFSLIALIPFNIIYAQQRSESDDFSYALKLYNEKFYDLAAQQFSSFTNNYPGSNKVAEAGYYGAMALFHLQQYENARIDFQRVALDYPRHDRAAESWYMIGECYILLSNDEEAAKAFEMVKLLHPQHQKAAESILRAGQIYQKLNKYETAEQLFNLIQNRYIESTSYFPSVLAQGKLYLDMGRISKAKQKLEKVLDSNSGEKLKAQAWYYLGESYTAQGSHQQAIPPYQTIIEKYKKTESYPKAVLSLSKIYLQQEKFLLAQQIVSDALNNKPSEIYRYDLQEYMADSYYLSGKYALAGKNYIASLESPDSNKYIQRHLKLALSWYQQKNMINATNTLQKIILDKGYRKASGYNQAKELYFKWSLEEGDFESGLTVLYTLQSNNDLSIEDQMWLVSFLKDQENWQGIIRELQPAIYSDLKFGQKDNFLFEIASANEQLERFDESARFYKMLLEEYASSELAPEAEDKLAYIRNYYIVEENMGIGQLALLMGDVINRKDDALLQFNLGKIYYENLKDYPNALVQFKKALQSAQDQSLQVEIYLYIGLTYQKLAENRVVSVSKQKEYLNLAKENLGRAMENSAAAANPDLIASHFVFLGIKADDSPRTKQIGYFETLVQKYPESSLRERWFVKLGELYTADANNTGALKYLNAVVGQFPHSKNLPLYLYERAVINLRIDRDKSINDFKTIAGSYPHSRPAANALYNLGLILETERNYEEAHQIYHKVLTDYYYTDLAEKAKLKMGDSNLYSGQSARAVTAYQKILNPIETEDIILSREFISDSQAALTFKLAKAYFNQKDWNNALRYFLNYVSNNPQGQYKSESDFLLGELYMAINDPHSAINNFENIPKTDQDFYTKAIGKVAAINFELENYSKAAENYKNLEAITTDIAEKGNVQARQIVSLIRAGQISAAEKLIKGYRDSYKSNTDHLSSFQFEFGDYYRQQKNFDQAVKFLKNVKKYYPKSSYVDDADYYLALTYIAVNRHKDAIDILTKFAKQYSNSDNLGAVLNTLGSIYFRSEKYESAIISFKSAMEKPLKAAVKQQVLSNLIKAYTFVNFWDAALALCREYISTYPEADDAIDKKILMGRAYVALNQVDRAVELLKETRLIADSEREPEIQFYIGDAYFQNGQYENAITEYVKIPLLSRKTKLQWEASALYYSGQAYEKLGRINDAKRMYEEIVKRPGIDAVLKKEAQKRISEIEHN